AERLLIERILQLLHLAEAAQPPERAVGKHGETGRVIASILEAAQSLHQDRCDVAFRNRTHDAAHSRSSRSCSLLVAAPLRYFFFCGRRQPGTEVRRVRARFTPPRG